MSKILVGAIAALGLSASAASAATVSFTDSFGPSLTEFTSSSNPDVNSFGIAVNAPSLALGKFDAALGTLNSVQVTLTGGFETVGSILNTSAKDEKARVQQTLSLYFSSALFGLQELTAAADTGFVLFPKDVTLPLSNLSASNTMSIRACCFQLVSYPAALKKL